MGISLITCTGGRPEAFKLLEGWMLGQASGIVELQWIIVDDCDPAVDLRSLAGETRNIFRPMLIRPKHRWTPGGPNTLAANLGTALEAASYDKILFIEDDEAYLPNYLNEMSAMLDRASLAGQSPSRYYHVGLRKWKDMGNYRHASLCQTGIRREMIPKLLDICKAGFSAIDLRLWQNAGMITHTNDVVGMKGLPGRPGIGIGHRPQGPGWIDDPHGYQLETWLGPKGAAKYAKFAV